MHKKLLKGIAVVMSAALVLGSVVTGAVPAKAAEASVQGEDGLYTTTFNMSELSIIEGKGYNAEAAVDGTSVTMTFTGQWGVRYFEMPKAVLDAGFKGAKVTYAEANENVGLKCAGDHEFGWDILVAEGKTEITADPAKVGDGTSGTRYENYEGDRTADHIPFITAIGLTQTGSESCTVVAQTITFITDKAVEGGEAPVQPAENRATYALTDLECVAVWGDGATAEGTTLTMPGQYNQAFYTIPEAVLNAGLIACEAKITADNTKYSLKFVGDQESQFKGINVTYESMKVTTSNLEGDATEADIANIKCLGIMSTLAEGTQTLVVDSVTFITTNPVEGAVDPGTDPVDPTPAKPGKVKITKATSTKDSVKLTWKKVKNCTEYEVYRSTSKNGEYKKIKTVKKTTFTNKKLKAGKQYFYKVKAVNKDTGAEGAMSAAKSIKTKK